MPAKAFAHRVDDRVPSSVAAHRSDDRAPGSVTAHRMRECGILFRVRDRARRAQ
jgi:hypothetical protein